jgi:hypothetical protein
MPTIRKFYQPPPNVNNDELHSRTAGNSTKSIEPQKYNAMKKLKPHHYIILLTVCVAITVIIVALTLGKNVAISVLCTGIGCIIGLIIGTVIKKKSDEGK